MDVRSQYIIKEDGGDTALRMDTVSAVVDGKREYAIDLFFVDKGNGESEYRTAKGMTGFTVSEIRHIASFLIEAADDLDELETEEEMREDAEIVPEPAQQTPGPKAKNPIRLLAADKDLTERVSRVMSETLFTMGFIASREEGWHGTLNLATIMLNKLDEARAEDCGDIGEVRDTVKSTMSHYLTRQGFIPGEHKNWGGTGPLVDAAWPLVEGEL